MTHSGSQYSTGGATTNTQVGSSGGYGVRAFAQYQLDIVPLTKTPTGYAASQSSTGGALALTAGTGVTQVVGGDGVVRYQADVARAVTITSAGNDAGITFLIKGYDAYGVPVSQTLTGANAGTATTTKTFLSVSSITPSAATASTVTAGTADVFGLPIAVLDKVYIATQNYNNTTAIDGGTLTIADSTAPATTVTGDVRGTYTPSSASNGTKRLLIRIAQSAAQTANGNTVAGGIAVLGQTQV